MAIKISAKLEEKIKKNFREALHAISQQALVKNELPTNQEVLDYLAGLVVEAAAEHNADARAKCRTVVSFPNK